MCTTLQPCVNGTCLELSSGNYHCVCDSGFMDRNCSTAISGECASDPCVHALACHDISDSDFYCECESFWEGRYCNVSVSMCNASSPCENNSTCYDMEGGDYVCKCGELGSGKNCSTPIDTTSNILTWACEGQDLNLGCTQGTLVIDSANYGRTITYAERNCGSIGTDRADCDFTSTDTPNAKEICDRQASCSLAATNAQWGDNCDGTLKYLEVVYHCSAEQSQWACEGQDINLACTYGTLVIDWANYGRTKTYTDRNCGTIGRERTNCDSSALNTPVAKADCDGQTSCTLPASNTKWGDNCGGVLKYLEIVYHCTGTHSQWACENNNINLACTYGTLVIDWANYGRTQSYAERNCGTIGTDRTDCDSSASNTPVAKSDCDGQASCSLPVTNTKWGDNCGGSLKYLQVIYHCV